MIAYNFSSQDPRVCLYNIMNVESNNLENSIHIKGLFPKILNKFKDNSKLVYTEYPMYRLTCNLFENYILEGLTGEEFRENYKVKIQNLQQTSYKNAEEYIKKEEGILVYYGLMNYIENKILQTLESLVNESNEENFLDNISKGKNEIFLRYISNISIMYGFRLFSQDVFIFYYQPYYEEFNSIVDFITNLCMNKLNKNYRFVLSFRFINKNYKDKINIREISEKFEKTINFFREYHVSYIDNVTSKINGEFKSAIKTNNLDQIEVIGI